MKINIGHFARIPADSIFENMRPRARQVFNHLALRCSPERPCVWVKQAMLAEEMHVHQQTAGRWVRYLEKIGRIVHTGRWVYGRYKEYRMVFVRSKNKSVAPPIAKINHNLKQNLITNNKLKTNQIKKQTQASTLCDVGKKLHGFQIPKSVVINLIKNFSKENCEKQLKHLEILQKQNKNIFNKAAWLTKAIKENFSLPENLCEKNNYDHKRRVQMLERDLNYLLAENKFDNALTIAKKILTLEKNNDAQKAIEFIEKKRKEIKQKISSTPKNLSPVNVKIFCVKKQSIKFCR